MKVSAWCSWEPPWLLVLQRCMAVRTHSLLYDDLVFVSPSGMPISMCCWGCWRDCGLGILVWSRFSAAIPGCCWRIRGSWTVLLGARLSFNASPRAASETEDEMPKEHELIAQFIAS